MPKMNGKDFCQIVRNKGYTLPVILNTGYNETITIKKIKESGFDGFLKKPFTLAEFNHVINEFLP